MSELPQVEVTFTRSEVVFRHVVRVRLRIPTRRQQRLAARRAGTASSFKQEWRRLPPAGICLPISYEAFARGRAHFLRSAKLENLVTTKDIFDLYQRCKPSTAG
jgi:hypothetical protein